MENVILILAAWISIMGLFGLALAGVALVDWIMKRKTFL